MLPWGIWLFTLYRVACGHRPVLHILAREGTGSPHCSLHGYRGTAQELPSDCKPPLQLWDQAGAPTTREE